MLHAWRELQRIRRDTAALAELPVAALQALTANINRDTKRRTKPFTPQDFAIFRQPDPAESPLPPNVAAVALALRAERLDSPILLAAWDKVLSSATETGALPTIRALHTDDKLVWIVCPDWEGRNIRGGLVAVGDNIHGPITVRDIDRPLMTYTVVLPDRRTFAWLEAGLLLKTSLEN